MHAACTWGGEKGQGMGKQRRRKEERGTYRREILLLGSCRPVWALQHNYLLDNRHVRSKQAMSIDYRTLCVYSNIATEMYELCMHAQSCIEADKIPQYLVHTCRLPWDTCYLCTRSMYIPHFMYNHQCMLLITCTHSIYPIQRTLSMT